MEVAGLAVGYYTQTAIGDDSVTKIVEGVLTIVQGFKRHERSDFVRALVSSGMLSADEQDILVIESRRGGPTRPLDTFIKDMKRKGRLS